MSQVWSLIFQTQQDMATRFAEAFAEGVHLAVEELKISLNKCACTGANMPKLVQPALLCIIASGPAHGYAVMQKLAESGLFNDAMPDSAGVYRFLNNMENDGSLQAYWDTSETGPARKCYKITSRGIACLRQWRKTLREHREFIDRLLGIMG